MSEVKIRISRVQFPVTVLGPGNRLVIWLQGCTLGCPGCMAKDTWEVNEAQSDNEFKLMTKEGRWSLIAADGGSTISIQKLVELCKELTGRTIEGVTISGGEPFQQSEALLSLLKSLRNWTDSLDKPVDYLCYSGYPYDSLQQNHQFILDLLDTIIPEPFLVEELVMPLRGSANQPVIPLSALGSMRLEHHLISLDSHHTRQLQIEFDGNSLWYTGIPQRGELEQIVSRCREQGIELINNSW